MAKSKIKYGEEERIYVIVAETVQPNGLHIIQPNGRIAAQVGHVVSKVIYKEALDQVYISDSTIIGKYNECPPVTTIVLSARNSAELKHVGEWLSKKKVDYFDFYDTNPEYDEGSPEITSVLTAIATTRVGVVLGTKYVNLDWLPLWRGRHTI